MATSTDKATHGGPGGGGQGRVDLQTLDPLAACHRDCKPLLHRDPSSRTPQEMETGIQALVRFGSTVNWDVVRHRLREEPRTAERARTRRFLALLIPLYDQLMAARGLPAAPVGDIVWDGDGWRRVVGECEEVLLDGSTAGSSLCASCSSSGSSSSGEANSSFASASFSSSSSSSSSSYPSSMPSPAAGSFSAYSTTASSTRRAQVEARVRVKPELGIFYHGEDMAWGVPVPVCGFPPRITFTQEGTVTDGNLALPLGPGTTGESVLLEMFAREDLLGSFSGAVISADGWLSCGAFQTVRLGPGTLGEQYLLLMRYQGRKYGPCAASNLEGAAGRPGLMGQGPSPNASSGGPVPGKFGGCSNADEVPQFPFQGGNLPNHFQNKPNGSNEAFNASCAFTHQPNRVEDVEMGGMDDIASWSRASNACSSVFDAPFLQRGFGNHDVIQPQQRVDVFYGGGGGRGGEHGKDHLVALLDEILEAYEKNKTQRAKVESDDPKSDVSEPMDVDEHGEAEHMHNQQKKHVLAVVRVKTKNRLHGGRKGPNRPRPERKAVSKSRKRFKRREKR